MKNLKIKTTRNQARLITIKQMNLKCNCPSGCYQYIGEDCKEWFVKEMCEQERNFYNLNWQLAGNKKSLREQKTNTLEHKSVGCVRKYLKQVI